MGKEVIKVKWVDYWNNHHLEEDITYRWLAKRYDIELSEEPDYIFYSCFGQEHLEYDCVRIFYSGENFAPNFNECDYAISCEKLYFGDRHIILPNFFKYRKEIDLIKGYESETITSRLAKRKFCSYVVSNGNADPIREEIFSRLSEYKKVDSGGKFKNNVGGPVDDKLSFQSEYKFAIAFENSSHIGYTTEKILQAFASRCVPIYWGDPLVYDYFNKGAFVNLNEFSSMQDMIDYIVKIDNDDELYLKMLNCCPWSNSKIVDDKMDEFDKFMGNIFSDTQKVVYRRNKSATSIANEQTYRLWENAYYKLQNSIGNKIKNKLGLR